MTDSIARFHDPKELEPILDRRGDRLDQLLAGTGIPRERFIGMTIQAVARQPKVLQCTQDSIVLAVLTVAEMGLIPSGAPGGAYLVPYGAECGYIVAYQGLITMAMRSGVLIDVYGKPVYSADEFDVVEGTEPRIDHHPSLSGDRGTITHFYAVGHLANGGRQQHVMTLAEVEAIRDRNRQWEKGPWGTADWIEMGRKTPVRNLMKYVPTALTPLQAQALEGEDRWADAPAEPRQMSSRRQRLLMHAVGGAEPDSTVTTGANGADSPNVNASDGVAALGGPEDADEGMPDIPEGK